MFVDNHNLTCVLFLKQYLRLSLLDWQTLNLLLYHKPCLNPFWIPILLSPRTFDLYFVESYHDIQNQGTQLIARIPLCGHLIHSCRKLKRPLIVVTSAACHMTLSVTLQGIIWELSRTPGSKLISLRLLIHTKWILCGRQSSGTVASGNMSMNNKSLGDRGHLTVSTSFDFK